MKKYFIPRSINGLRQFLQNFRTQIGQQGGNLGLSGQQLSEANDSCNAIINTIDAAEDAQEAAKAAIKQRDETADEELKKLRKLFEIIKTSDNYDQSIGSLLGLIGEEIVIDHDGLKPVLKAKNLASGIKISFVKGKTHGVRIFCKRGGESEFKFLDKADASPFWDARPNLNGAAGEERQYYAVFVKDGDLIGERSDILTVKA